jgi:hypothetical protein
MIYVKAEFFAPPDLPHVSFIGEWPTTIGAIFRKKRPQKAAYCRLQGLKKGGMRRLARAGGAAPELMATSGHKTMTEVERYTIDADRKKLADSGMAKLARPWQEHQCHKHLASLAQTGW